MRLRVCMMLASALGAVGALALAYDMYRRLAIAESLVLHGLPANSNANLAFSMAHVLGTAGLGLIFLAVCLLLANERARAMASQKIEVAMPAIEAVPLEEYAREKEKVESIPVTASPSSAPPAIVPSVTPATSAATAPASASSSQTAAATTPAAESLPAATANATPTPTAAPLAPGTKSVPTTPPAQPAATGKSGVHSVPLSGAAIAYTAPLRPPTRVVRPHGAIPSPPPKQNPAAPAPPSQRPAHNIYVVSAPPAPPLAQSQEPGGVPRPTSETEFKRAVIEAQVLREQGEIPTATPIGASGLSEAVKETESAKPALSKNENKPA
ncbi:MAG TPA: hypothetical protein VKX17_03205 [Planctomycetota bacterium]|nr:hypothetical protein [Planctomycetota bacterium]